ncbi:hypothetical protein RCL1_004913 [Eukaryota sp. TZLM3-RCL]
MSAAKNSLSVSHVKYELCLFAITLYDFLGRCAFSFLGESSTQVSARHKKPFDITAWRNRFLFTIFKHVPTMIDRSLEAVSVSLDDRAVTRIVDLEICFDDIDF